MEISVLGKSLEFDYVVSMVKPVKLRFVFAGANSWWSIIILAGNKLSSLSLKITTLPSLLS